VADDGGGVQELLLLRRQPVDACGEDGLNGGGSTGTSRSARSAGTAGPSAGASVRTFPVTFSRIFRESSRRSIAK